MNRKGTPQFVLEWHNVENTTTTSEILKRIVSTLSKMASMHQKNKTNGNKLAGQMGLIGYCPGTGKGKKGGFNNFLSNCLKSLSSSAYQANSKVMRKSKIPNWPEGDKENPIQFALNVSVTWDGFYNKDNKDKANLNPYTYVIFCYIDKKTGLPIAPRSTEHGTV
ncbi:hypothetical protein PTTG_07007 [Puccinia triticina 1-1 BBBD Race 1]|uniref:Tet-like 2OG-Fe(II) oxygenase domain-containing protein n=1 Tax=Puccinia triticina (isolate 1-1 / race 1 (BBBD)) TaxID=630390 RepID=A0A180GB33_PUCT1|nr:hypothetical protein PTTG_07007 [Puccinia triticina 1-1 BBBD Race 1]